MAKAFVVFGVGFVASVAAVVTLALALRRELAEGRP